jgi:hypothetical protein
LDHFTDCLRFLIRLNFLEFIEISWRDSLFSFLYLVDFVVAVNVPTVSG